MWTAHPYTAGSEAPSVAVANGMVYVGVTPVVALDALTGSQVWSFTPVGDDYVEAPAVANGVVYVGGYAQGGDIGSRDSSSWRSLASYEYALDASTGAELWSFPLGGYVPGTQAAPAVANGVVYVTSKDGLFHAVDASSGGELWSFDINGGSPPTVANGRVYVGSSALDGNGYAFGL